MKKFFIATVALCALVTMASCKKDFTCECTSTDADGNEFGSSSVTYTTTKKKAKESCDGLTASSGGVTTTCELK